jgi:PAS domain S-box-containing protein
MMPGMDGFEVCARLRADSHLAEVPVIMLTALDDRDSRLRGLQAGVDDFISKPFDPVELRARIKTITRLNRYRRLLLERIYRQQAEAEVYRRNRELTLLNQMLTAVAATLNVQDILYLACEALAQAFELPRATGLLLNEDWTQFVTIVEYITPVAGLESPHGEGYLPSQADGPNEVIPLTGRLSEYLSQYKTPLAIVGEQTEPALAKVHQLMREYGLNSLLVVPLLIGDQPTGVIELGVPERLHFNDQDLTLAQSIATAIGQALETAQLYQNLQHYADSLEETVERRTQELKYERDRMQAILEALGEAVIVTDTSGAIQYLNPAATTLTGFPEEEAIGQNWQLWQSRKSREEETGDDSGEQLYHEISGVVRSGQTWHGEVNNKRKDGGLYDALLTVAPLFDPDRPTQPIGFVSVQSNITPLKEAERLRAVHQEREKQAALDRLRHTFLSSVNHEMRTPLALIFQTIEMLEDTQLGELTQEQLDALTALRRQARILGGMVEGLTRVAAFLSKQETVRPVLALLEPVFQNLIPLADFKARSKEITVETELAPNLPPCRVDIKQMEEALIQLLDNAVKYNQPGGKIRISAQANNQWVMIAISDTGIGIEEEQMNRIWEMFEQGADPLKRAQEGLGLGLVLARYIVEAHRGIIEVDSTLGQGSTFTVKLPRINSESSTQPDW